MISRLSIFLLFICVTVISLQAQESIRVNTEKIIEQKDTQVRGRDISAITYGKHSGIHLSNPNDGDGVAWITEGVFGDVTIELDIRGRNDVGESFVGVSFADDGEKNEIIYLRPFNFKREGRTFNAVQYVHPPDFGWRRLREEHPGVYESNVDPAPEGEDWVQLKIELEGDEVRTYINEIKEPVLVVERISDLREGRIGLWVGSYSVGDFANIRITKKK